MNEQETIGDDIPKRYAVRYYERASRDIDEAMVGYADYTGDERGAVRLRNGIRDTAYSLSDNPEGNAVAEGASAAFGFPVRRALSRLSKGSRVAYHLIYYIVEAGADGDAVFVMHVRHASRAEITKEEAREILAQK